MKTNNEILAEAFCKELRAFAEKPENIDNLESYLSYHFDTWFKKFVTSPENLIYEMQTFAQMEV